MVGSVEKVCEIGRKREENLKKAGQFGTRFPFFPVPFFPLFHNLTTFPSSSFDQFCQPNQLIAKMGISGLAASADLPASADICTHNATHPHPPTHTQTNTNDPAGR
jgi:hypothetical protein